MTEAEYNRQMAYILSEITRLSTRGCNPLPSDNKHLATILSNISLFAQAAMVAVVDENHELIGHIVKLINNHKNDIEDETPEEG